MKEFIVNNPIFSYIAVPILLIAFVVCIVYVLKPRNIVKDFYSRLYGGVLDSIEFIDANRNSFKAEHLKMLLKMLTKIKHYYELLESEELYEVEVIIIGIEKSLAITRALQTAKSSEGEIADYLMDIDRELKEIRKVLYSFTLTRAETKSAEFSPLDHLNAKKSKKKAEDYLKNLHNKQ